MFRSLKIRIKNQKLEIQKLWKKKRKSMKEKIAKDRKVIPDPIDDRKLRERN